MLASLQVFLFYQILTSGVGYSIFILMLQIGNTGLEKVNSFPKGYKEVAKLRFESSVSKAHTSVQLLSLVQLFATPWTAAHQASLSITNSQSLLRLMSESVMPSSHLILCCPLLLLPPIPPSIRVFSNKSTLRIRWPKY